MYFGIRPDHFRMNDATDEEKLAWLREQGIKYTMSYRWTYGDSKESYELKKKTLRDLGMTSISAGLAIPLWGDLKGVWLPGVPFEEGKEVQYIDKARKFAEMNKELGVSILGLLPPMMSPKYPKEITWYKSLEYYHNFCEMAKEFDMAVSNEAEAEFPFISCNFYESVVWHRQVDADNFTYNADTTHYRQWCLTKEQIRDIAPMVLEVHCNDGDGRHVSLEYGKGDTPMADYLNWLLEFGPYEEVCAKFNVPSVAMLEYHDPADRSPDQSDTILRCIDWAKENLTMLDWD